MSLHEFIYPSRHALENIFLAEQGNEIHQHLQTQFTGMITKLQHDLEEMLQLDHDVLDPIDELHDSLHATCYNFSTSEISELSQSIEQFCKDCHFAIEGYKATAAIYQTPNDNDMGLVRIDNTFNRFITGVLSVINYAYAPITQDESHKYQDKTKLVMTILTKLIPLKRNNRSYP